MVAPSSVSTIGRVVKMLGEDEDLLRDIATDMEPEDGVLTVWDIDEMSTVAFTAEGIENLKELLADLKR
jgi:hypothetical protein